MLQPSKFDKSKWGCPRCGWPLDRRDDMGDGGVTCACGGWVPLPEEDPPQPQGDEATRTEERRETKMNPNTYSDLSDYQDPQHVEHLQADTDARRMNLCPWCGGQAHGYGDCPDGKSVHDQQGGWSDEDVQDAELRLSWGHGL